MTDMQEGKQLKETKVKGKMSSRSNEWQRHFLIFYHLDHPEIEFVMLQYWPWHFFLKPFRLMGEMLSSVV